MSDYFFDGQIPSYRSSDLTKSVKIDPDSNSIIINDSVSGKILNINSQQLSNNSGQSLLFSDIYLSVNKTNQNTATFASSTLSVNGSSTSYQNSNINFTGSSNTISTLTLTNMVVGGIYYIGLYNGGSNNLKIDTGLGTNIKTIHSSSVNISNGSYGLMKIIVLTINSLTRYIVQVNSLTN